MTRSASWLTALVWKGEDLWRSCSKRLRMTIRYPDTNPIKKVYSDFLKRAWFRARVNSRYPDTNSPTVVGQHHRGQEVRFRWGAGPLLVQIGAAVAHSRRSLPSRHG